MKHLPKWITATGSLVSINKDYAAHLEDLINKVIDYANGQAPDDLTLLQKSGWYRAANNVLKIVEDNEDEN